MRTILRAMAPLAFLTLALAPGSSAVVAAVTESPDDVVAAIKRDWRDRRKDIGRVRCQVEGTIFWPSGTFKGEPTLPPSLRSTGLAEELQKEYRAELVVDFAKNRLRITVDTTGLNLSTLAPYPWKTTTVFDGHSLLERDVGVSENRALFGNRTVDYKVLDVRIYQVFTPWHISVPLANGYDFDCMKLREVSDIGFAKAAELAPITFAGEGAFQGIPCTILRTAAKSSPGTSYLELWVDRARQSAVVSVRVFASPQSIIEQIDIDYTQRDQRWRPSKWTAKEMFSGSNSADRIVTASVIADEVNPPLDDSLFLLPIEQGMIVWDQPNRTTSVVAAGNRRVRLGTAEAETLLATSSYSTVEIAVVACAATVVTLIFAWRLMRRRWMRGASPHDESTPHGR